MCGTPKEINYNDSKFANITQNLCDFMPDEILTDFSNETPYVFNVFIHKIVDFDGSTPDEVGVYNDEPDNDNIFNTNVTVEPQK